MHEICSRHGLDAGSLRREVLGSHVVFRADGRILKLFSPLWGGDHTSERAVLTHICGLPAPRITEEGDIDGWPYLALTIVPGLPALDVWSDLEVDQRADVVRQLGELMRKLHGHPPVHELAVDWDNFIGERIAACDHHHRAEEPWRSWIHGQLDGFTEPPFTPVLLSADITEDHLLLSQDQDQWLITGFIDFGDAMMGHPYYDFIAPLAFYCFGEPDLSYVLLDAYGLEPTDQTTRRLTTYCLLHRFEAAPKSGLQVDRTTADSDLYGLRSVWVFSGSLRPGCV